MIYLATLLVMVVFDLCIHVADLWAIKKTGQKLILFKTWKAYNAFWISFWLVAAVMIVLAMVTR